MTTPDDLPLPCPFCGHVGLDFAEGSTFRWLAYSCGGCGIGVETRVQTLGDGTPEQWRKDAERDAVKEWNQRAAAPAAPARVLHECLDNDSPHLICKHCGAVGRCDLRLTDAQCDDAIREAGLWQLAHAVPTNLALLRGLCRAAVIGAEKNV